MGVVICGLVPPSPRVAPRTRPGRMREENAEGDRILCTCAQSRPDIKVYKTSFMFLEFLGHSLQTEYIHCAYSKLTLQNDLHLCYLRSSSMVQGG